MEVIFFSNSTLDSGISGGDVRFIEIAKRFAKRGVKVNVVTSRVGVETCKKMGLDVPFHVVDATGNSTVLAYIEKALRTCLSPPTISDETVLYTCHDFFCDVIPAAYFSWKYDIPWVAVIHWIESLPWKRGLEFGLEWVQGGLYNMSQTVTIPLIKSKATVVHAVSSHTASQLLKVGVSRNRIRDVQCGIDRTLIERSIEGINEKIYDAIYLKSLVRHKGIFDAIKIWRLVCDEIENAKLAIVGFGTDEQLAKVRGLISSLSLDKNVEYHGLIQVPERKFRILKQSKLLLHPSYDENWGIVIGESMASGIPVVAYGLPVLRDVWRKGMISVPLGDLQQAAKAVLTLLRNQKRLIELSEEAHNYSYKYDWDIIADEELKSIEEISNRHK